jgi:hypothetical protein
MQVLRSGCLVLGFATLGLALIAAPLRADETFICEDGSMVTLTSANREAMTANPCVKHWFAKEAAAREAKAGAVEAEGSGRSYAGGVARRAALGAAAAAQPASTAARTVRVHVHAGGDKDAAAPKASSAPRFRLRRR